MRVKCVLIQMLTQASLVEFIMTLSDFRRITDEMLSAYIDGEVTEQERTLIEAAIAQDEEIAWRLNSLRQTVSLLRELPELALPRAFMLTPDQVQSAQAGEQMASVGATARRPVATPAAPPPIRRESAPQNIPGFWDRVNDLWRTFWQGGNPMLRNAAAVSFVLMLLLAGGGPLLNRVLTQPIGMMATAPEAPAPQAEGAASAPAAEAVAIAPTATALPASDTAMLQAQEDSATEAAGEETPAEENTEESARVMQAEAASPAEAASEAQDETQAESSEAARSENGVPESDIAESEVAESAEAEGEVTVEAADAAVAAAAEGPAVESATAQDVPDEESAVAAAAMAAPEQPPVEPPLAAIPFPSGGEGARSQSGGGMGGGGPEGPAGMGGGEPAPGELVPPQAYTFDESPVGGQEIQPAAEEVTASVAAASVAESSTASVAEVAATPAVEVPAPEVAAASAMTEAPAGSSDSTTASEQSEEVASEAETEVTATPTAEAVALIAPGEEITSSEVVENVSPEGAVAATGPAGNLPVVWVAQGSLFLVTILLTSLWWRSRTPRRPR